MSRRTVVLRPNPEFNNDTSRLTAVSNRLTEDGDEDEAYSEQSFFVPSDKPSKPSSQSSVCSKCKHVLTVHQAYSASPMLFKRRPVSSLKKIQSRIGLYTPNRNAVKTANPADIAHLKRSPFVTRFLRAQQANQDFLKPERIKCSPSKIEVTKLPELKVASNVRNRTTKRSGTLRVKTARKTVVKTFLKTAPSEPSEDSTSSSAPLTSILSNKSRAPWVSSSRMGYNCLKTRKTKKNVWK